jgi:hypothetical protein
VLLSRRRESSEESPREQSGSESTQKIDAITVISRLARARLRQLAIDEVETGRGKADECAEIRLLKGTKYADSSCGLPGMAIVEKE